MKKHAIVLAGVSIATGSFAADIAATDIEAPEENIPSVITPTRLRQPLRDVPASVSVITAETLSRYAITNVPDALRLVPGMAVTRSTGSSYTINYHGTNARSGRRMNVLIDGISVYQPGLSEIDWAQLPVAIEDIARIEVTRSPNSATYGPNSMMATINIITKDPSDTPTGETSIGVGTNRKRHVFGRVSGTFGDTTAYLSMSRDTDAGYSSIANAPEAHDSNAVSRLLFRSKTTFGDTSNLALSGSYSSGRSEVPLKSEFEAYPDKELRNYSLGAVYTKRLSDKHELQISAAHAQFNTKQEWTTCFPRFAFLPELFNVYTVNPNYANTLLAGRIPSGGSAIDNALALQAYRAMSRMGVRAGMSPLCGMTYANVKQTRSDIEIQDTFVASDKLRIVAGGGLRAHKVTSETYVDGRESNTLAYGFATAEYKPTKDWTLNVGGYLESDRMSGTTFAPRAAVNYHITPNQTVRFVMSRGVRTPDIVEQRGNISYPLQPFAYPSGLSGPLRFYQNTRSSGGLRPEIVVSREIGYMLNLPEHGLTMDVKAFNDSLRDLISQPVTVTTFKPNNDNSVNLSGVEAQVSYKISPETSGFLSYAYLRNHGASTVLERSQYSRHSGAVGISHDFKGGYQLSGAYYGASGNDLGQNAFGRLDLALSKTFFVEQRRIDARLRLSRLNNPTTTYFRGEGASLGESTYRNRLQIYADVRIAF